MKFRRILTPAILIVTLLVQFLPGTVFGPRPVAATACDAAQFMGDITIPDGTSFAPGAALIKTWRFKNIGTCTWSTSYAIVFYSGTKMGAPSAVNLTTSVAPGATVDVTVNMTAPTTPGHYRGYWMLRNASNVLFGVGPYGTYWFFIDIVVTGSYTAGYDFVAHCSDANWTSGAGALTCPGTDGSASGYVLKSTAPQLEDGTSATMPGLIVAPNNVTDGYISGTYPAIPVQSGDQLQTIVSCQYGVSSCYVTFRLDYQIDSGPVYTLWSFREKTEGLYYRANVNLSSLAGHSVKFTLKVMASGSPAGDRVVWGGARIVSLGGTTPPPLVTTCDKAAFVSDVTIPDGTVLAAGTSFTKTWRLQNVGSCTWTTSYKLVFAGGDYMGVSASAFNLATSVAPGGTIDLSVNLTAPLTVGNFYGYWRLQNASGTNFGVGASGTSTFFVYIKVLSSYTSTSTTTTITADAPDPSALSQSVPVSVTVSGAGATPTGTVAITGADTNCTLTLSGGSGSCNVVFNTTGAKTLTATYSGNANYAGSSDTESHTVSTLTAATTTITADTPDPTIPGQVVAVNVTVSGSGTIPTGTVDITGANTNCSITLSGGSGSCTVIFNTTGIKTLTATYNGNANYAGSSDTESHTVSTGLAATSTAITDDTPDPSTPGQAVVVSVTVSGAGLPKPSGQVYITGADTNCTITLSGGTGTCPVTFNTTGTKTLTATYSGDGTYAPSLGTTSHTVNKGSSTTTITADTPDPSNPTQAVAVSVTVLGAGVTPNGTVEISGADNNCTLTLSGGSGLCNVVFNTIGPDKPITATYSGDSNYLGSWDTELHTVGNVTTTAITSDNDDPSLPGDPVDVHFKVTGAGDEPTGPVVITGADTTCTITLVWGDHGVGDCSVTFNTAGAKLLTATYTSDDSDYVGSSGSASHTVSRGSTTTVVNPGVPDPSDPNELVTVSVSVTGWAGVPPTGPVAISISGGQTSTCTINPLSGTGTGHCDVYFTAPIASYTITATYSGDGNYFGSFGTSVHNVH